MGTPQRGARTVPVRSARASRGALQKSDVFGQDNPLRTGTVRGPMQTESYPSEFTAQRHRIGATPLEILENVAIGGRAVSLAVVEVQNVAHTEAEGPMLPKFLADGCVQADGRMLINIRPLS